MVGPRPYQPLPSAVPALTILEKGTGVRRVSTQKYHNIVTLEVMEVIQTSMTTEVVNVVVSISTNFYD